MVWDDTAKTAYAVRMKASHAIVSYLEKDPVIPDHSEKRWHIDEQRYGGSRFTSSEIAIFPLFESGGAIYPESDRVSLIRRKAEKLTASGIPARADEKEGSQRLVVEIGRPDFMERLTALLEDNKAEIAAKGAERARTHVYRMIDGVNDTIVRGLDGKPLDAGSTRAVLDEAIMRIKGLELSLLGDHTTAVGRLKRGQDTGAAKG